MAYWTWEPSLSVGIDVIDNQHRRIVDYINILDVAIHRHDAAKVGEVIEEMIDYTVTHFAFEEAMMEKAGYPFLDAHKVVHKGFARQIRQYQEQHNNGEDVARKLIGDLRIWLTNHIKKDDHDYAPAVHTVLEGGWVSKTLKMFFG